MADPKIIIELTGRDNATTKLVNGMKGVEQSLNHAKVSVSGFGSSLGTTLGRLASLASSAYIGYKIAEGFKHAISQVDEFNLTTIGVAATLTDLTAKGANAQMAYAENIAYSREMYSQLELEAAKHFASGKDMIQAWNILSQKGVVLHQEDIGHLGVIVDKIKLATAGQVQGIQIAQELRAMLSGQARATDQLAMLLKDRYGAAWEDILKQHREAGDLLDWLAGEFKGLQYANEDILDTMMAQKSTLETLLSQVGRAGLAGVYEDIVGLLKQVNNYLTEHKSEVAGGIINAWWGVKQAVTDIRSIIEGINDLLAKPKALIVNLAGSAAGYLAGGAGPGGDYGFGALGVADTSIRRLTSANEAQRQRSLAAAQGVQIMQTPFGPMEIVTNPWEPTTQKMGGTGGGTAGGGSGGGKGAADTVQKEIEKVKKEVEKVKKEAQDGIKESFDLMWDHQKWAAEIVKERVQLERDATKETATLWQDVMGNEQVSYQDRLGAAEQFKLARMAAIDDEIAAIKDKYGGLVTADTLAAYQTSQVEHLNQQVQQVLNPEAFSWESAWKRAAENVQDALADVLYNLVTQTKSAGDIIQNITNGVFQIISQMAAQSIMNMAKMAIQAANVSGGGGFLQSILGYLFGGQTTTFGSSTATYTSSDYVPGGSGFQNYHAGGLIYAHGGWPSLRSDEVPIIAQTGERVLSREQNRAYEAGPPQVNVVINNNASNAQATAEQGPAGDIIVTIDDLTAKAYNRQGPLYRAINSKSQSVRR